MEMIERRAGYKLFSTVKRAGPADTRYITFEHLGKADGTLLVMQQFLYYFAGLTKLTHLRPYVGICCMTGV